MINDLSFVLVLVFCTCSKEIKQSNQTCHIKHIVPNKLPAQDLGKSKAWHGALIVLISVCN